MVIMIMAYTADLGKSQIDQFTPHEGTLTPINDLFSPEIEALWSPLEAEETDVFSSDKSFFRISNGDRSNGSIRCDIRLIKVEEEAKENGGKTEEIDQKKQTEPQRYTNQDRIYIKFSDGNGQKSRIFMFYYETDQATGQIIRSERIRKSSDTKSPMKYYRNQEKAAMWLRGPTIEVPPISHEESIEYLQRIFEDPFSIITQKNTTASNTQKG